MLEVLYEQKSFMRSCSCYSACRDAFRLGGGQRWNELVGCWVAKDENGYVGAIQFLSNEKYYMEYQCEDNRYEEGFSSGHGSGEYCAEADGTLRLTDEGFFDYKVSGKKLTLVHGDETREFTKWDKNIGHIEEHPDWKK